MFGLGWNELLFVGILAVVVVGPDRLPEMMQFLGRQYGKLRRASDELRRAFMFEADKVDQEKRLDELRKRREQARRRADEIRKRALEAKGGQPDLAGVDPQDDGSGKGNASCEGSVEAKAAVPAPAGAEE
jgi:sec-independent protein translocase protein TatB